MKDKSLISQGVISEEEEQLIRNQLAIILTSSYFNSAKQKQRFLEYVVEKTLAGDGDLIKQYTIGIEALDLADDFDSDSNPIVRIVGGRVRKRLKEFYENSDDYKVIITIPKGCYTPEFISHAVNEESNKSDIKTDNYLIESSTGPSVALVSITDKTQSNLSNRLTQQVTNKLAKELSNLLFNTMSVYNAYADKSEEITALNEVDCDYIIYLCIQELPNEKHELVCRLSEGTEELWSEHCSIKTRISLDKQETIFTKIITQIFDADQGRLLLDWSRKLLLNKEAIPEKFQVFAYHRQYYFDLNASSFAEAVKVCEKALDRNPNDILAILVLSDLCRKDYIFRYIDIDRPLDLGLEYARKALHLTPGSQTANFILGRILYTRGDQDRGLELLLFSKNMGYYNTHIEFFCGFYLCAMERWDEGISMVKKAMSVSENYPSWYNIITSLDLYLKGRYQEAAAEAEKIMAPGIAGGPMTRCIAYAKLGDMDKAKKELKELAVRVPKLEQNGKPMLTRYFGNEKLAEQIWEGVEIAIRA